MTVLNANPVVYEVSKKQKIADIKYDIDELVAKALEIIG